MLLRTIAAACLATALTGAPLHAQRIEVNDNGWSRVDTVPARNFMVDINDDGYSRQAKPERRMARARPAGSGCTQLESALGYSGSECGRATSAQLIRDYLDRHD